MLTRAPIQLTLYNENDEPLKELSRVIVPWKLLKKSIRLAKNVDLNNPGEDDIDQIADLIIEVFGESKVTRDELDNYADIGEMSSVLLSIVSRARGLVPNAPPATN
jgi:hypothetical protein